MVNVQEIRKDRFYDVLYIGVAVGLLLKALLVMVMKLRSGTWDNLDDLLFSYAGGFIRRGLTGEILFFLKTWLHIPPLVAAYAIGILCFCFVAWYLVSRFRQRGYSLNVLVMGFALGGYMMYSISVMRRDYWELALLVFIVMLYRRLPAGRWAVAGNLIAILALLLHEATFFFMIPACMLMTRARTGGFLRPVLYWLPATAVFCICCLKSGTLAQLDAIGAQAQLFAPEAVRDGVGATTLHYIGMDSLELMRRHLRINFTWPFAGTPIPVGVITLLYFIYIPYMTLAMLLRFGRRGRPDAGDTATLVALLGFQFVCLLPMFTFLSCDMGRVALYWVASSLIVWVGCTGSELRNMFGERAMECAWSVGGFVRRHVAKAWLLTLLMLFVGVPMYFRTPQAIAEYSPVGQIVKCAMLAVGK